MRTGVVWAIAEPGPDLRHQFGRTGEALAERWLRGRGFEILDRRFRVRFGEIDLVARDGATVVFVEVKSRSGSGHGGPGAAVTLRKQRRMARVALAWLARRGLLDRPCRFDVVAVTGKDEGGLRVEHIRDAFRLDD